MGSLEAGTSEGLGCTPLGSVVVTITERCGFALTNESLSQR